MNDDLNTPVVISHLFDMSRVINSAADHKASLSQQQIDELREVMSTFLFDVMGLRERSGASDNYASGNSQQEVVEGLMKLILDIRATAKANKDWATSDHLRDELKALGISVKDGKDGATWTQEK
jgi:cysteinyl-tRNA synthetase